MEVWNRKRGEIVENKQKLSLIVPKNLHKALKDDVRERGLSINMVMIQMIEEYLKGRGKL